MKHHIPRFFPALIALLLTLPSHAALALTHQPHAPGIESKDYVWNKPDKEMEKALGHKGDPVKGKALYKGCTGCHKADASGRDDGSYPQLAGQHVTVLVKQLIDVRTGRRDNDKMHPFAAEEVLTTEDVADIAAYLNKLPTPATNSRGEGKRLEKGKALYVKDCAICHGDNGEGNDKEFYPMVAAQHYPYLLREARIIRDGVRRNANMKMVKAIGQYSE